MSLFKSRRRNRQEEGETLSERLVTLTKPDGVVSESYRSLRTSLLYSLVDNPPRVITFTSPGPREGKSTTCANLGVTLAQAGKNTLLLDCDLRKPVLHKVFELRNIEGVVDVIAGGRPAEEVWYEPVENLKVMTVGPVPPNPAEMLGSERFVELLARMRESFDYVLVDAPPVLLVSDPAIVAAQTDGVLLVLDSQNTRKSSVRRSIRSLESVGATILGTVMNNFKSPSGDYAYGGYTYSGYLQED